MAAIDDGGPAFPAHSEEDVGDGFFAYTYPGMTLRDYFAAQALAGMLSNGSIPITEERSSSFTIVAYRLADAMLRVRKVLV